MQQQSPLDSRYVQKWGWSGLNWSSQCAEGDSITREFGNECVSIVHVQVLGGGTDKGGLSKLIVAEVGKRLTDALKSNEKAWDFVKSTYEKTVEPLPTSLRPHGFGSVEEMIRSIAQYIQPELEKVLAPVEESFREAIKGPLQSAKEAHGDLASATSQQLVCVRVYYKSPDGQLKAPLTPKKMRGRSIVELARPFMTQMYTAVQKKVSKKLGESVEMDDITDAVVEQLVNAVAKGHGCVEGALKAAGFEWALPMLSCFVTAARAVLVLAVILSGVAHSIGGVAYCASSCSPFIFCGPTARISFFSGLLSAGRSTIYTGYSQRQQQTET